MKRSFWNDLEQWYSGDMQMPLMVIGARQVGKTYLIDKFCKSHFKKYCYINLMQDQDFVHAFHTLPDFASKVFYLESKYNVKLDDKDVVLFVDEVQESEEFIESLKFFCESDKKYKIICAGSLLGVKLKRDFSSSFPVGKVVIKYMYPMSFPEFLAATGNDRYIKLIQESFMNDKPLIESLHKILLDFYHQFLFLGGMPECILSFVKNNQDFILMDHNIISNIIQSYFNDMGKYTSQKNESLRISRIYQNIPSQLAKENQKFTFAKIDNKDNRKRDYITAVDWLLASNLILPCYEVTNPVFPVLGYVNYENYKLYMNDTGILCSMLQVKDHEVLFDGDYSYKGVLTENYVASELYKNKFPLLYWTRKGENKAMSEIDFLIQLDSNVIPVEVKANHNTQSKSLMVYREKYQPPYMIRISAKNFGFENNIKSVPLYAVFCMNDLVKLEKEKSQEKMRQQKENLQKKQKEIDKFLNE